MVLHKVSARIERTSDRTVRSYSKQFDKLFHHASYGGEEVCSILTIYSAGRHLYTIFLLHTRFAPYRISGSV